MEAGLGAAGSSSGVHAQQGPYVPPCARQVRGLCSAAHEQGQREVRRQLCCLLHCLQARNTSNLGVIWRSASLTDLPRQSSKLGSIGHSLQGVAEPDCGLLQVGL